MSTILSSGGFGNRRDVSVYSLSGFKENLPDLHVGRQYHACARYQDQYGKNVSTLNRTEMCCSVDDSSFRYFSSQVASMAQNCAINNGAEVVLTGGFGNRRDVSVYSLSGFKGNLPDLHVGRQYHACARYQDQYGENV